MKLYGIVAAATLVLAACTQQQEAETTPGLAVSDVRVEADLTAVASPQAATYWGNLESDLASAIATEFVDQTAPNGWIVAVDVDEIALSGLLAPTLGDDARLSGVVTLVDPASGEVANTYNVSASANQAASLLETEGEVVAVSPTSAEFYGAVLRAFASGVAQTVRAGAA